jgi:site-specific DNA-methyltransferase (adenine-specific)
MRHGIWVKDAPMPQLSADRPGMGWEALVFLHRADARPRWNGGGRSGVFRHPIVRRGLPTEKPVGLGEELVALFADSGGLVLDPFCGSGAFLEAARLVGCRALGVEIDPDRAAHSAKRLAQRVFPFDVQLRQEVLPIAP